MKQYFTFKGNADASKVMTEVLKLLAPINASILDGGGEGTDIAPWMNAGVPGASLKNLNDKYFYFHHTNGKFFLLMFETINYMNLSKIFITS